MTERRAGPIPSFQAFLLEPETYNVPEKPEAALHAPLVGHIGVVCSVVYQRLIYLNPYQAQGSAAQIGIISRNGRHSDHCACRVMAGRDDYRDPLILAYVRSRLVDLGKNIRRYSDL